MEGGRGAGVACVRGLDSVVVEGCAATGEVGSMDERRADQRRAELDALAFGCCSGVLVLACLLLAVFWLVLK